MTTQLTEAVKGNITRQVKHISGEERIPAETFVKKVAEGKAVIPMNKKRIGAFNPVGVGSGLRTKVNANLGTSQQRSNKKEEVQKLEVAIEAGADAIMDLSIGEDIDVTRREIIERCPKPLGTVPLYQAAMEAGSAGNMGIKSFLNVLRRHAEDGVDFVTIHAGITLEALPLLGKRLMGVVSRGGSLLVRWMQKSGNENFLYRHFDEIVSVAAEHDVTLSLGDGLRPGCLNDATDEAQLHELKVLGELGRRARAAGVQVMIEGPGHVPLGEIAENVRLEKQHCDNAPFYVLGPLPTDIAAGYDHLTGAIGGAAAAAAGADFLCYLTPREHIGLPNASDVREGVVLARIAAHIGDIEKKVPGALEKNQKMSEARTKRDWKEMARYVIDPQRYEEYLENEDLTDTCSMCGELCAVKVYRESGGRDSN